MAKKKTRKKAAKKKVAKKKVSRRSAPAAGIEKLSGGAKKLMLANLGLYGKVLDELVALVSHVRIVPTAEFASDLHQRRDLLRWRVHRGRIDQRGRNSNRPRFHRLADERFHLREFLVAGPAVRFT